MCKKSLACNCTSVADPGCLSRIPDPDFYPSRIQKQQEKRGVKKICCHTFFCSHKFHKIEYYLIFDMLKTIIWPNFQRTMEVFTQKIVTKLSKIWVWDPRSGIRKKPIPDPGVKKAPDPGSGSATLYSWIPMFAITYTCTYRGYMTVIRFLSGFRIRIDLMRIRIQPLS